jgi:hypothetical protein
VKQMRIECEVHFGRGRESRKVAQEGPLPEPTPVGNVPRVSRLMALAIRFDRLIKAGEIADQAEIARLGHVTRARVTQIMNLLNLTPDIREEILFLPPTQHGRDPIPKIMVRPITATRDWCTQWCSCSSWVYHASMPSSANERLRAVRALRLISQGTGA